MKFVKQTFSLMFYVVGVRADLGSLEVLEVLSAVKFIGSLLQSLLILCWFCSKVLRAA